MVDAVVSTQPGPAHLRGLPSPAPLPSPSSLPWTPGGPEVGSTPDLPTAPRIAVASAQEATRVPGLAALLAEVDRLRRDLRADLTLAATAVDAGEPALAGFLLRPGSGPTDRLEDFRHRALAHLHQLEQDERAVVAALAPTGPVGVGPVGVGPVGVGPAPRRVRRWLLPATPLVAAAAALFGFLAGVAPDRLTSEPTRVGHSARADFALMSLLADGDAPIGELSAAAAALHASLLPLLARAAADPVAAAQALSMLRAETELLQGLPDSAQLSDLIDQARLMVSELIVAVPGLRPGPLDPVLRRSPGPVGPTQLTSGRPVPVRTTPPPSPASRPPSPRPSGPASPRPSSSPTDDSLPTTAPDVGH